MDVKQGRNLDTTFPPAWLARLELGMPPRRLYALAGAIAFLVGAMISTLISQWLTLPGILLALCLLWVIAVNTGQRLWLAAPFLIATFALIVFALFLIQDRALAERGSWVNTVVVEKSQTRSNSACTVRLADGRVAAGPMGGCRDADVGDSVRLFVDPEGEVAPSNTAPNVALWIWLAAAADIVLTVCVVRSAVIGVRRLRELRAVEQSMSPTRYVPPPPPPPPAPTAAR
ncbi:hypothetical protein ABZX60_02890 [Streptomyces olivaceus]|uniref:hypothetical protein n=1 Tax=Streptomyces olivaceus TaxID=47716 RepID=UPI0033BE31BE